MTDIQRKPAADNYPWILISLLWMVSFLNAADRSILNSVKPLLRDAFDITDIQLGIIDTTFFWTYAVCAFVFGRVGDSVRRRNMIIFGLIFWSMATGIMPFATGFAMLLGMRTLVAVGESTYYPTATALISSWHKPSMRSRALSIHQTAVFAGGGIGGWVAGKLADSYGWSAPFIIFAALGFVVMAILCIAVFARKDPVFSRAWLGFGAVITVLLALIASFGLLFTIGVPFTNLTPVRRGYYISTSNTRVVTRYS